MDSNDVYMSSLGDLPQTPLDASHVNHNDLPWVDIGLDIKMKMLGVDHKTGTWTTIQSFPAGTMLPKHRHSGSVVAFTLQGNWRYLEQDFTATPGSLIQETANSAHTLSVNADNEDNTIVLFIVQGSLTHYDDNGNIWGIDDAETMLDRYLTLAKEQQVEVNEALILG